MVGSNCSKSNLTLESRVLSQTITPSLVLKNTPPIIAKFFSYNLYSETDNLDSISLPVSSIKILLNACSQAGKRVLAMERWFSLSYMVIFLSINFSIPCTINLCKRSLCSASLLITFLNLSLTSAFNFSTNS